jgi:hypothetical protein
MEIEYPLLLAQKDGDIIYLLLPDGTYCTHESGLQIIKQIEYYIKTTDNDSIKKLNIQIKAQQDEIIESMTKYSKTKYKQDKNRGDFYIMKHGNIYKIGIAVDVNSRYKNHLCSNPDMEMFYNITVDNRKDIEEKVKERFQHEHYKREWFKFTDIGSVIEYVESIAKVKNNEMV